MEEKDIHPAESLAIIEQMVLKAKQNFSDDSFYYILWGWLTFVASLAHFLLLPYFEESASMVWLLMPLGGLLSVLYGRKQNKQRHVTTYTEAHMGYLWKALGLAMIVLVAGMFVIQSSVLLTVFILLYAIGTFTSGGILQFKPLIIGGLLCFGISLISFFVKGHSQLLLIALAILVSYLIPGYALKSKYKNHGA